MGQPGLATFDCVTGELIAPAAGRYLDEGIAPVSIELEHEPGHYRKGAFRARKRQDVSGFRTAGNQRPIAILRRKEMPLMSQLERLPDHPKLWQAVVDAHPYLLRCHGFHFIEKSSTQAVVDRTAVVG